MQAAPEAETARGTAVIFISHKLAEVEALCDDVTILRQGRVVHSGPTKEISTQAMAEKMIGAKVELPRLERTEIVRDDKKRKVILEFKRASAVASGVRSGVRGATFEVRAGEIVGVAGVDGNGQTELVHMIVGTLPVAEGEVWLDGVMANRWTVRRRMEKVAYVPGDRHAEAVGVPLSLVQNMMMKEYRAPRFSTMGWLRLGRWRSHTTELLRTFDVRYGAPSDALGTLSGGNQQKLVLARELHHEPEGEKPLVVAVNPTRGLDVGATAFVMRQLLAARADGAAVLLVHSDLDELLAISDRVLVIYNGILRESGVAAGYEAESIGRMMLGLERSARRRAERRQQRSARMRVLREIGLPVAAIVVAVGLVLMGLGLGGYPALAVLREWTLGAVGTPMGDRGEFTGSVSAAADGLAAAVAFRCGVLNIGAEGQFMAGALAVAALTTRYVPPGPAWLTLTVAILIGSAAGAGWAFVAGAFEHWRGVPVVLSTILLNFVAVYLAGVLLLGPLQAVGSHAPQTPPLPDVLRLPVVMAGTQLHVGVFLAAALAVLLWVVQARTVFGYELLVTGVNPVAAELAGIPVAAAAGGDLPKRGLRGARRGAGGDGGDAF